LGTRFASPDSLRGKILCPERKKQLIDYRGIRYGKGTPTDIDGFIEWHGKVFVFYEYKTGNNEMPFGQELAYTHLVDAIRDGGRYAVYFLCKHNTSVDEEINGAECVVEKYYYNGKWYPGGGRTAKEVTDSFREFAGG
jgi:hypothetical protein